MAVSFCFVVFHFLLRDMCVTHKVKGSSLKPNRHPHAGEGTSGITYWPAMSRAPSRFSRPSFHSAWMGT